MMVATCGLPAPFQVAVEEPAALTNCQAAASEYVPPGGLNRVQGMNAWAAL